MRSPPETKSDSRWTRRSGTGTLQRVYGVPPDLDLLPLVGSRIINVGLGLYNTQFSFEIEALDYGGVNAEGRWEVIDALGAQVGGRSRHDDSLLANTPWEAVLGASVVAFALAAPMSFDLALSSGILLRFYDDSDTYESMTIHPGDYVI